MFTKGNYMTSVFVVIEFYQALYSFADICRTVDKVFASRTKAEEYVSRKDAEVPSGSYWYEIEEITFDSSL
jgi:hypothetical protein